MVSQSLQCEIFARPFYFHCSPCSVGLITEILIGITETNFSAHHDPAVLKMMNGYLEQPHIKNALKSTEQGAASIVLAAVGRDYEGVGGFYMEDCAKSPPLPEDAPLGTPGYKPWAYDKENEGKLWEDSLGMVGLAG